MTASLSVMAAATISPALPGLAAKFADNPDAEYLVRMLVPAPALAIVLFASIAGWITDRLGRRRPLLIGLLLFAIAGSAGLYLPDLNAILASRFILGLAMALIMTVETALVGDSFNGEQRKMFTGWQIAATNFGGFLFIAFASWLTGFDPRLAFAVYLVPLIYIPVVWCAVRPENAKVLRNDEQECGETDKARDWVPVMLFTTLLTMASVMCFFMMPTQFPFYAGTLGLNVAQTTGIGLGALTLVGGLVALFNGPLTRRVGIGGGLSLGFAMMAGGYFLLATASGLAGVIAGSAAIGAGFSTLRPAFILLTLDAAPAHRRGLASGVMATGMFLGQFLSPVAFSPMISTAGYEVTFLTVCALLTAAGTVALAVRLTKIVRSRVAHPAS